MKVKFGLNKELDKGVIPNFMNRNSREVNSAEDVVFEFHPKLKNLKEDKEIFDYIERFYKENSDELSKKVVSFRKEWRIVEAKVIRYLSNLFPDNKLQNELAYAYLTIIAVNPRWPEYKMFQLFYRMNSCIGTISHELCHFYFFKYCDNFHSDLFKNLNKENPSPYWHLSEIVNNVLLSTPEAIELIGEKDNPYPEHVEIFEKINKVWMEAHDIDKLIIEGFKIINKWLNLNS